MQTEQMIAALVADSETRTQSLGRQIATAIVPVVVLTTAGFYLVFGLRDDLSAALRFQTRLHDCLVDHGVAGADQCCAADAIAAF